MLACTWKRKRRLNDNSDQIISGPLDLCWIALDTIFGPQIAWPWLLHRYDWCYWLFHFITLLVVSTLTCYWDYDKILKLLKAFHLQGLGACSTVQKKALLSTSWGIWVWFQRDTGAHVLSSQWKAASSRKRSCSTSRPTEKREKLKLVIGIPTRVDTPHKRVRQDH